jgi:hypothetical protein
VAGGGGRADSQGRVLSDGRVSGTFCQDQPSLGFTYEGAVTCFAVDQVNHRAWIAGVVTSSNDPDPVTEVGDDVWFRVLDAGKHSADPDRSTFFGFEQPPPGSPSLGAVGG